MFDFLKSKKENFHLLTEVDLAEIRRIGTSPPPGCNGVVLKKDLEKWEYCNYMYNQLKPYYKIIDEERERKREEKEFARLKAIQIARAELKKQEDERRAAIEAKRREEIRETFQEMEEIVKEIRETD
jgi:hypothetical protein